MQSAKRFDLTSKRIIPLDDDTDSSDDEHIDVPGDLLVKNLSSHLIRQRSTNQPQMVIAGSADVVVTEKRITGKSLELALPISDELVANPTESVLPQTVELAKKIWDKLVLLKHNETSALEKSAEVCETDSVLLDTSIDSIALVSPSERSNEAAPTEAPVAATDPDLPTEESNGFVPVYHDLLTTEELIDSAPKTSRRTSVPSPDLFQNPRLKLFPSNLHADRLEDEIDSNIDMINDRCIKAVMAAFNSGSGPESKRDRQFPKTVDYSDCVVPPNRLESAVLNLLTAGYVTVINPDLHQITIRPYYIPSIRSKRKRYHVAHQDRSPKKKPTVSPVNTSPISSDADDIITESRDFTCTYVYIADAPKGVINGAKKGTVCGKPTGRHHPFCSNHYNQLRRR